MTDTANAAAPAAGSGPRTLGEFLVRFTPDTRAWMTFGLFVLAWKVLAMIERNPALLANASFMVLCGLIVGGGGLGLANTFFFGGTKTGSEVMTSQSAAQSAALTAPAAAK